MIVGGFLGSQWTPSTVGHLYYLIKSGDHVSTQSLRPDALHASVIPLLTHDATHSPISRGQTSKSPRLLPSHQQHSQRVACRKRHAGT